MEICIIHQPSQKMSGRWKRPSPKSICHPVVKLAGEGKKMVGETDGTRKFFNPSAR